MLAFEAFRTIHRARPDFTAWQRASRPLGELDSLQKILKLGALLTTPPSTVAPKPPAVVLPHPVASPGAPSAGPLAWIPMVPKPANKIAEHIE
jgi:hypothetical protein